MMATELRWIIAALSLVLLLGIWWWGARRSRQATGNSALREPTLTLPNPPSPRADAAGGADEWEVSPLDPLSIRTAEFEEVTLVDREPLPIVDGGDELESVAALPVEPAPAESAPAESAPAAAPTPAAAPVEEKPSHIVTIRVSAGATARWRGADLLEAMERHGLTYGRYKVFHRAQADGRTLFYAASLVEPGAFDLESMPRDEFRGVTLFAVLPGPGEPMQTLDALIGTAADLAATLDGVVQDSTGVPLTLERAMQIREEAARNT